MFKIKVKLCSPIKEIAGESELVVDMEERSNLQSLIEILSDKYGKALKKIYHLDGNLDFSQHFLVSVNNRIVSAPNLAFVELKSGDTVEALEPVAGG